MEEKTSSRSPFQEILAWAKTLPLWQQGAMRAVLVSPATPSPAVISELADHCVAEHEGATVSILPLSTGDLPLAAITGEPVTLLGFGHANNVNALRSDQWINVGPKLTIVFGNNASGKSGYGRILKKAFRARIVEDLHPNVRAETFNADAQGAIFEFRKGSGEPYRATWTTRNAPSDDEFSRFAVMDAKCGHAYVTNNELQLAPQGLDVVPRFIELLDLVKSELRERRTKLSVEKKFLDGVDPEADLARFADKIGATTEWDDVRPRIEFPDAKKQRLEEARTKAAELRAKSPKQIRSQLQTDLKGANTVRAAVEKRHAALSREGVAKVRATRAQLAEAAVAAKKVKGLSKDRELMTEIGSDPWIELMRAAGRFVASTQRSAPGLELDARCPLCLEALSPDAKGRLERYWAFINDAAAEQQTRAEKELSSVLENLTPFQLTKDLQLEAIAESLAAHDGGQLPSLLSSFIALAASTSLKLAAESNEDAEPVDGEPLLAAVDAIVAKIDAKLSSTPKDDDGAVALQSLEREIRELQCAATLTARSGDIRAHIGRLREINRLDAAHAAIKSSAATKKSNELYEAHLTNAYRLAVEKELKNLSFARQAPVLVQDGPKGKVKIILLANPKYKSVTAEQVFSEGERTAIAIASFFAELSLDDTQLGLIFDDPISSLDHRIRERVAQRLVEESLRRQVVVFTHDLVFLTELNRVASDKNVAVTTCELSSTSSVVGVVTDSPPWDALKVNKRLSLLESLLKEAKDHDEKGDPDELARALHRFYGLLRSTWERFIEEKMFAGAIERFDRQIKPNSLYSAILEPTLVDTVVKQINAVSGRIEAHDHSAAMNTPPATLIEAAADLDALRSANATYKALSKQVA